MDQAATTIDAAAESLDRKEPPAELRTSRRSSSPRDGSWRSISRRRPIRSASRTSADLLQGTQGLSFESCEHANAVLAQLKKQESKSSR